MSKYPQIPSSLTKGTGSIVTCTWSTVYIISGAMSVSQPAPPFSGGRHGSTWNRRFYPGNQFHHAGEHDMSSIGSGQTAFVHAGDDNLSPPCLNWRPLELFLKRAQLGDPANDKLFPQSPKSCLIVERRLSSSSQSNIPAFPQLQQTLDPNVGNHAFGSHLPQSTGTIVRKTFSDEELYRWVLLKVSFFCHPKIYSTTCASIRIQTTTPRYEYCTCLDHSYHSIAR